MNLYDELKSWYSILKDEFDKPYMNFLINRINDIRDNLLCPSRSNVFRAFKECDYSNVRMVIFGQD